MKSCDYSANHQYGSCAPCDSSEDVSCQESSKQSSVCCGDSTAAHRKAVEPSDIRDSSHSYDMNLLEQDPGNLPSTQGFDFMQIIQLLFSWISRLFGNGNGLGGILNGGSTGQALHPLSFGSIGSGGKQVSNPPTTQSQAGDTTQQSQSGPGASETTASPQNQTGGASGAGKDIPVDHGGPNTISVTNKSDKVQCFAIFTNPGPGPTSSFDVPNGFVTLRPGESANFKVPAEYSGYVQQMNNYTETDYLNRKKPDPINFKATRAEVTFGSNGTISFNKSSILGYNADMSMSSAGQVLGRRGSVISEIEKSHPGLILNIGGQKVIDGPDSFKEGRNMEAAAVLDQYLNNNGNPYEYAAHNNIYVLPDDHHAVRVARSNQLSIEIGNA